MIPRVPRSVCDVSVRVGDTRRPACAGSLYLGKHSATVRISALLLGASGKASWER